MNKKLLVSSGKFEGKSNLYCSKQSMNTIFSESIATEVNCLFYFNCPKQMHGIPGVSSKDALGTSGIEP